MVVGESAIFGFLGFFFCFLFMCVGGTKKTKPPRSRKISLPFVGIQEHNNS